MVGAYLVYCSSPVMFSKIGIDLIFYQPFNVFQVTSGFNVKCTIKFLTHSDLNAP
jgi:hypothetical protein